MIQGADACKRFLVPVLWDRIWGGSVSWGRGSWGRNANPSTEEWYNQATAGHDRRATSLLLGCWRGRWEGSVRIAVRRAGGQGLAGQ